jgi:hypothetical protein
MKAHHDNCFLKASHHQEINGMKVLFGDQIEEKAQKLNDIVVKRL